MSKEDVNETETEMSCPSCDATFTVIADEDEIPNCCVVCGDQAFVLDDKVSKPKLGEMVGIDCPDCGEVTVVVDAVEDVVFCPICGFTVADDEDDAGSAREDDDDEYDEDDDTDEEDEDY